MPKAISPRIKRVISPVLLLAFNRPDLVEKQLQLFIRIGVKDLYVHLDGPRKDNENDIKAQKDICNVINSYNRKFSLKMLIEKKNLGCKMGVYSGISWFFKQVDKGIIIEDDCLGNQSFFRFCTELLEKYRNNSTIMQINGSQFFSFNNTLTDYWLSKIPLCWGWATWKRAWKTFEVNSYDSVKKQNTVLSSVLCNLSSVKFWLNILRETKHGKIDTWDYQWIYHIWKMRGKIISPKVNLVTNVGFDMRATHTKLGSPTSFLPQSRMSFPMQVPSSNKVDQKKDKQLEKALYAHNKSELILSVFSTFLKRIRIKLI